MLQIFRERIRFSNFCRKFLLFGSIQFLVLITATLGSGFNIGSLSGGKDQVFRNPNNFNGLSAPFAEKFRLLSQDREIDNNFGYSVAISGNTAVVGAFLDDTGGFAGRGSAYIYVKNGNGWVQQQEIVPNDPGISKWFGFSVAISGDTIVVGAFLDNTPPLRGSAYVFTRSGTTWTQQQKLLPTGASINASFGYSVAISGDFVLVGAYGDTINQTNQQGSAYFFTRTGDSWTQRERLTASDGGPGHIFGTTVAIEGDTAVIGAPQSEQNTGSAYVFRRGTSWTQEKKLTPSNGATGDYFGLGLALSGNTIAVGAPRHEINGNAWQGQVYIYKNSGTNWTEEQKLSASDGAADDSFGHSVAIVGNICLVGSFGTESAPNRGSGAVYFFERNGAIWTQNQKFFNQTDPLDDSFSSSIGLSGDTAVIGAAGGHLISDNRYGSAYIYERLQPSSAAPFDFDGDRKTDVSIFRPSNGQWWYLRSSDLTNRTFQFGSGVLELAPADYTGDGKTDIAIFGVGTGEWFILRSEDGSFYSFPFGRPGDRPMPADYDGDGKADAAVFRPSSGTWFINKSSGGILQQQFGVNGDSPVAADFDGDSKADIAIYRRSTGQWWIDRSSSGLIVVTFGGVQGDYPVQADYTGDGKTDVAFFRQTTNEWFVLRSEDFSYYSARFGADADTPTPGDYDGDGKADLAIFRPSSSTWYLQRSTSGFEAIAFGTANDIPVPSAFVR